MHQIGDGVLGPVFRAYDPEGDRLVAVKAFTIDLTPEQADLFADALRRIVEVGLDHPAIVAPMNAGLEDGVPFMAQEYVTAESLDVAMRHYAPAQPERMLTFVRQLAAAVDAAHVRGVVHGAMHLRDVFVTPDDARATGFGVASALEHVGLRVPVRRPYTAPEMITGRRWGPEADRFAVATIAYELLTGKRATGPGDEVLARLVEVETADVADPAGLQQAFRNALADDPALRPASAVGFVAALGDAVGVDADETTPAMAASDTNAAADSAKIAILLDDLTPDQPSGAEPAGNASLEPLVDRELDQPADDPADTDLEALDRALEGLAPPPDGSGDDVAPPDTGELAVTERETPSTEVAAGDARLDDDVADDESDEETHAAVPTHEREPLLPLEPEEPALAATSDVETLATGPSEMTVADAIAAYEVAPADDEAEDTDEQDSYAPLMAADVREPPDQPEDEDEEQGLTAEGDDQTDEGDPNAVAEPPFVVSDGGVPPPWEELPPPPSRTSVRAMVPVAIAMAIGVLVAYVVSVGLGTTEDDDPAVPTDVAAAAVEPMSATSPMSPASLVSPASPESSTANVDDGAERAWSEQQVDAAPNDADAADRTAVDTAPAEVAAAAPPSTTPTPLLEASVAPPPSVGWILVRTDPPGATVRVDGHERGVAPLSLADMPHGTYRLEVSAPGYTSEEREVAISADTAVAAVSVMLARVPEAAVAETRASPAADGSVYVDSRPPGAAVFVDGERVGVTPLLVPDVTAGSHRVRIEGNGYQPWTTTVTVRATQRARVAASLEPGTRR